MTSIDAKTFLSTLFPPALLAPDEVVVVGHEAEFTSRDTGEAVQYFKHFDAAGRRSFGGGKPWCFCVSTVHAPPPGEKLRRRRRDLSRAWVLVLDDIGTKAAEPPVAPSYALETSAGNYQWGYLLDPLPVNEGSAGPALFDGCLKALADAGFNDPGCRGAARMVKLPGAVHRTGFEARVTYWDDCAWTLEGLMAEMGVKPARVGRQGAVKPGQYSVLDEVPDPLLAWLRDQGRLLGGYTADWVHIECPWRDTHTDGAQGASSTSYSPDGYGREGRQFKCMHGHCSHRAMGDFLQWAHSMGYRQ